MASNFVATRGSAAVANAEDKFQFVSYESRKPSKNKKIVKNEDEESKEALDNRKGIDINRARREIIKFGMSGFSEKKQQQAKIALAVNLGAKPPKGENKNYKVILKQKQRQKRKEQSYKEFLQAGRNKVKLPSKKFNDKSKQAKTKKAKSLLGAYGKVAKPTK